MKWVSVEDGLPQPSRQVLVTDGKWVTVGHLRDLRYHTKQERAAKWQWGGSVTHWMPFPEAPGSGSTVKESQSHE